MGTAPALSAAKAALRLSTTGAVLACQDTDTNASDFVADAPLPHQATSSCGCF